MSKRPKSLTEKQCAEIAFSLDAIKTAKLIEEGAPHFEIVRSAMTELHPRDFRDLLERARDRSAAAVALMLLRDYSEIELRMDQIREIIDEIHFSVFFRFAERDWSGFKSDYVELKEDIRKMRRDRKLSKALIPYADYHRWFVMLIGDGPDVSIMRDVLFENRSCMTYELGEWLRKKIELLERTPEQIAANKAAKREVNRIYWDPSSI